MEKGQSTPCTPTAQVPENMSSTPRDTVKFIRSLPFIYLLMFAPTGNRYPVIFRKTYIYVFSKDAYAAHFVAQVKNPIFTIQKLSQADFVEFAKQCCRYGISEFILDRGIKEHEMFFNISDFSIRYSLDFTQDLSHDFSLQTYNGALFYRTAILFSQLCALPNSSENEKHSAWGNLSYALRTTLFFVPVCYSEKDAQIAVHDQEIHLTEKAAKLLNPADLNRQDKPTDDTGYTVAEDRMLLSKTVADLLAGNEQFQIPILDGRFKVTDNMTVRPYLKDGRSLLPAFTDLSSLLEQYGPNIRIGLYTFADLAQQTHAANSATREIIIDPGDIQLCLQQQDIHAALHYTADNKRLIEQQQLHKIIGKSNKKCKQSLIFGILGIVFSLFGGSLFCVLAIIYGKRGQRESAFYQQEGYDKALVGSLLGWIGIILSFLFSCLYLYLKRKLV